MNRFEKTKEELMNIANRLNIHDLHIINDIDTNIISMMHYSDTRCNTNIAIDSYKFMISLPQTDLEYIHEIYSQECNKEENESSRHHLHRVEQQYEKIQNKKNQIEKEYNSTLILLNKLRMDNGKSIIN